MLGTRGEVVASRGGLSSLLAVESGPCGSEHFTPCWCHILPATSPH